MCIRDRSATLVTSVTRVTAGQPPWLPTLPTPWSTAGVNGRSFAFLRAVDLRRVELLWVDVVGGDLLGEQAVGPAVNRGGSGGVRGVDQAEDFAAGLVDPVAQVVDIVAALQLHGGGVGVRGVAQGERVAPGVHVHEHRHETSPRRAGLLLTTPGKRPAVCATSGVLPKLVRPFGESAGQPQRPLTGTAPRACGCLLYTSDAADEEDSVD